MNKKFILIILCLLIIGAVVFRFYLTVPKELEKNHFPRWKNYSNYL